MRFVAPATAAVALALTLLGGCKAKQEQGGTAAGEVLEGSVSDAMIATDNVRAEPPLAPRPETGATLAKGKGETKPKKTGTSEAPKDAATPTAETSAPPTPATSASPD